MSNTCRGEYDITVLPKASTILNKQQLLQIHCTSIGNAVVYCMTVNAVIARLVKRPMMPSLFR